MKVLLKLEHIKHIFDVHYNRFVDDILGYYYNLSWPRMSKRPLIWSIKEWLPEFYMATINPDNESEGYACACIGKALLPCGEVDWEQMRNLILEHYVIKITTTDIQFRYDFGNTPGVQYDEDFRDMLFKIYCDLVNANCHLLREAEYQEYLRKEKTKLSDINMSKEDDNNETKEETTTEQKHEAVKKSIVKKHEAVKKHCEELAKKHNIKFFEEFVAAFNRSLCNTFNSMNPKSECYDDFTCGGKYVISLMRNITGRHCWELSGSEFCDSHETNTNPHRHLVSSHVIWSTPRRTEDRPYPEIGGPLMYIELYYDDEAGTITCHASTAPKAKAETSDWMFVGKLETRTSKFGMTMAEKMTIRKFSIPDCPGSTNALNLVASKFNNTLNWAEIYYYCEFEEEEYRE